MGRSKIEVGEPEDMTYSQLAEALTKYKLSVEKRRTAVQDYLDKYLKDDVELDEDGLKQKEKIMCDRRKASQIYYDKNKEEINERRRQKYIKKADRVTTELNV